METKPLAFQDIKLGMAITNGTSLWLVTDIGSRVVAAIHLDEIAVVSSNNGKITSGMVDPRVNRSWLSGPPYAQAEQVLDEDFLLGGDGVWEVPPDQIDAWVSRDGDNTLDLNRA